MYPSESKRHLCLLFSDPNFIKVPFYIGGGLTIVLATILLIIFRGQTLTMHGQVNGVPTTTETTILPICAAIYAFGLIFMAVAHFFIPLVGRLAMPIPTCPVIAENRISKEELLARALYELREMHPEWDVAVNGNWIDVTWNWKNAISLDSLAGMKIAKNVDTYTKMIEVRDDYTYQELDMRRKCSVGGGPIGISFHKSIAIGHMQSWSIEFVPGIDLNDGIQPGLHKYQLDTGAISDAIHEWLGSYGYSFK